MLMELFLPILEEDKCWGLALLFEHKCRPSIQRLRVHCQTNSLDTDHSTQRFQTHHFPIRANFLPLDFKSAMNFNIVNVEKLSSFYPKSPFKVDLKQINVIFLMRKLKSSTFTPHILNIIAWSFQNSFSFGSSSYQKKECGFEIFFLTFSYCTGLISTQWLNFCLACSMTRFFKVHL